MKILGVINPSFVNLPNFSVRGKSSCRPDCFGRLQSEEGACLLPGDVPLALALPHHKSLQLQVMNRQQPRLGAQFSLLKSKQPKQSWLRDDTALEAKALAEALLHDESLQLQVVQGQLQVVQGQQDLST